MSFKAQFADLLEKEMDRNEFIKNVGIGLVALTGLGMLSRVFLPTSQGKSAQGYGDSAYGGFKNDQ